MQGAGEGLARRMSYTLSGPEGPATQQMSFLGWRGQKSALRAAVSNEPKSLFSIERKVVRFSS